MKHGALHGGRAMVTDFRRATSVEEAVSLHEQGYVYLAGE